MAAHTCDTSRISSLFSTIQTTVSWWLPAVLLLAFHTPGLFLDKLRLAPAYSWSLWQPDSQPLQVFDQDALQGSFPAWRLAQNILDKGLSWEWNPFIFSGSPLWPEGFFPVSGVMANIAHIIGPESGYSWFPLILGIAVIVVANLILRELQLPAWARCASVIFCVFSHDALAWFKTSYNEYFLWLLAGLLFSLKIWKSESTGTKLGWAFSGAAACGLMHLGTHVQFTLLSTIPFIAIFIFCCSFISPDGTLRKPCMATLGTGAFMCMAIAAVGLWAWLPTLEASFDSYRAITPKTSPFPVYLRFMPFPLPKHEDLLLALSAWFGFHKTINLIQTAIPIQYIPIVGFSLDGHYLSLTAYGLGFLTLFERRTRRQAMPFIMAYVVITLGYNVFALVLKIPQIHAAFTSLPLATSVNLPVIVIRANVFIWLLSGFGLVAATRLDAKAWRRTLTLWTAGVAFTVAIAFIATTRVRSTLMEQFAAFQNTYAPNMQDAAVEAVATQVGLLMDRWTPMPWQFAACLLLLAAEVALIIAIRKHQAVRKILTACLTCSFALSGYISYSDHFVWTDREGITPRPEALAIIQNQESPGRMVAVNFPVDKKKRIKEHLDSLTSPDGLQAGHAVQLSLELPFMCGMSNMYGVEDIRGVSSLNSLDYRVFLETVGDFPTKAPLSYPLLLSELTSDLPLHLRSYDLLNVRWVLSSKLLPVEHYRLVADGPVKLYENLRAMPRAWVTNSYEVIPKREEILKRLRSSEYEPWVAILEAPLPDSPGAETRYVISPEALRRTNGHYTWQQHINPVSSLFYEYITPDARRTGHEPPLTRSGSMRRGVSVTAPDLNKRVAQINADEQGLLVFSEPFHPGWHATVDGAPRDIHRADFALMAVQVEPGDRIVELEYRSRSREFGLYFTLGVYVFLAVGSIVFCLHSLRTRAKKQRP